MCDNEGIFPLHHYTTPFAFLPPPLASLRYGVGHQVVFDYRVSVLVCAGTGPHPVKALLEQFLKCKKKSHCRYADLSLDELQTASHSYGLILRPPQLVWV